MKLMVKGMACLGARSTHPEASSNVIFPFPPAAQFRNGATPPAKARKSAP